MKNSYSIRTSLSGIHPAYRTAYRFPFSRRAPRMCIFSIRQDGLEIRGTVTVAYEPVSSAIPI